MKVVLFFYANMGLLGKCILTYKAARELFSLEKFN